MSTKYKSSKEVPTDALLSRAEELADAITKGQSGSHEFTMRIPAECDRDADLVMCELVKRFKSMQKEIEKLQSALGDILNPIPKMQKEAEKNDCDLNGVVAQQLAHDCSYLREIVADALAKSTKAQDHG